jgi:hypothetical protein
VLKDWELKAMQVVWSSPEGANSRTVWQKVNQMLGGGSISRASVINFCEAMQVMGVLSGEERTGKGGHHWVYGPAMSEVEFKTFVAQTVLGSLKKSFSEETNKAIKNL